MRVHFALSALALVAALPAVAQVERTGEQIVKQQCASCHEKGLHGAPRIDDRAAWSPRMKAGLDAMVKSATAGHGKMPARGGLANTTDAELRAAIAYMFNPAGIPPRPAPPAAPGPNQKTVDGIDIFLGVKPIKGDAHTVTITLRDAKTRAPISDAQVEVRITNPVMGAETKKLEATRGGDAPSYGNQFRISGREPHVITVEIRRPQAPGAIQARFDYKN